MNSTFHLVVEVVVAAAIKHNIFIKKSQLKFRREWKGFRESSSIQKVVPSSSMCFLEHQSLIRDHIHTSFSQSPIHLHIHSPRITLTI